MSPPRGAAAATGLALLASGLVMAGLGLARLADAALAPALVVWVALPLLGGPLSVWAGYQLYGLATAEYQLDRDALRLRWGLAYELIPFDQIESLRRPGSDQRVQAPGGLRLPGCHVGAGQVGGEQAEFFATHLDRLLLARVAGGVLAFSPEDPEAFLESFVRLSRMGSVQPHARRSERPQLLPALIWSDRWARALLLLGLVAPFSLLGYLVLRASALPPEIPLGFLPSGAAGPMAPAGRLLLLPLVAGLIWLVDLLLGAWLYRREADRPLSYALWGMAAAVGALMWGGALYLVSAAA